MKVHALWIYTTRAIITWYTKIIGSGAGQRVWVNLYIVMKVMKYAAIQVEDNDMGEGSPTHEKVVRISKS